MFAEGPYLDDDGRPVVKPSYCVFADFLGFGSRVLDCPSHAASEQLCVRLHRLLTERSKELQGATLGEERWRLWEFQMFSDSVVLGCPIEPGLGYGEPEFGTTLGLIARYQLTMALEGFFVRGGFTIGELHMSNQLCFGKALVEAHGLEQQHACVPRILLSSNVVDLVHEYLKFYGDPGRSPEAETLLVDSDDHIFIDYLGEVNYSDYGSDLKMLAQHRDLILKNLAEYAKCQHVLEKYLWLRDYHNHFCATQIVGSEEWAPSREDVEGLRITVLGDTSRVFRRLAEPGDPSQSLLKSRL